MYSCFTCGTSYIRQTCWQLQFCFVSAKRETCNLQSQIFIYFFFRQHLINLAICQSHLTADGLLKQAPERTVCMSFWCMYGMLCAFDWESRRLRFDIFSWCYLPADTTDCRLLMAFGIFAFDRFECWHFATCVHKLLERNVFFFFLLLWKLPLSVRLHKDVKIVVSLYTKVLYWNLFLKHFLVANTFTVYFMYHGCVP